jgi:hypothetical protein
MQGNPKNLSRLNIIVALTFYLHNVKRCYLLPILYKPYCTKAELRKKATWRIVRKGIIKGLEYCMAQW